MSRALGFVEIKALKNITTGCSCGVMRCLSGKMIKGETIAIT